MKCVLLQMSAVSRLDAFKDLLNSSDQRLIYAADPDEAIRIASIEHPDLIISGLADSPSESDLRYFEAIATDHPGTEHVILTSAEVDRFIPLVRMFNIGSVLVDGIDEDFRETVSYLRSIIGGSNPGFSYYFPAMQPESASIKSYAQAKEICSEIIKACPGKKSIFLDIVLDELISNAFFHAMLNLSGLSRECWLKYSDVKTDCSARMSWVHDNEKLGVSVVDPIGKLRKRDVLKWLDTGRDGFAVEEHGKGFLLVRRLMDRMIINLEPGKKTECMVIQYYNGCESLNKPLMVQESV